MAQETRCTGPRSEAPPVFGGSVAPIPTEEPGVFNTGLGVYIPVVLYVCFIATCLWTLAVNPRVGVYLLAVIVPLQRLRMRVADYPLGANLVTVLVLCVFVGALFRGMKPRLGVLAAPLITTIVYLYLSLWWGTVYRGGEMPVWLDSPRLFLYKEYLAMLMLAVVSSQVLTERGHIRNILLCFFISLLAADRSAFFEFIGHDLSHFDDTKRMGGPFANLSANELAAYLSQFALFTFGFAFHGKLKLSVRWLLYGLAAFTTVTMMYCYSRGAYVAFLTGLVVFALVRCRKSLAIIVLLLSFSTYFVPHAVQERIAMMQQTQVTSDNSAEQRVVMWKEAVEDFTASPLLGNGFGIFTSEVRDNGLRDTHNYYLKVLADTGVAGFALFTWLVVAMFRTAVRVFRSKDPMTSGMGLGLILTLSSLVVTNVFGDRWTYVEINGLLWILLAGAGAIAATLESRVTCTQMPVSTRSDASGGGTFAAEPVMWATK